MSTSLDDNFATPPSALVEDGQTFYENHLRATLEPNHFGEFVAIEPTASRYFIGQTATAALGAAHDAMPEGRFYLTRIGRNVAHKIGGHGARIR